MNKYISVLFVCFSLYYHCMPCEQPTKKQRTYNAQKTQLLRDALDSYDLTNALHLIDANADPAVQSAKGETVLHQAVRESNGITLCSIALHHGVDPNGQDNSGETPAMGASTVAILSLLVSKGANIHKTDNYGRTALHHHAINNVFGGTADTLSWLCDEGSDPNAPDDCEHTALHSAVQFTPDRKKLAALCMQGADHTKINIFGKTPRETMTPSPMMLAAKLYHIPPTEIAIFDAIVPAATTVRTSQQEARSQLIAVHVTPALSTLVNSYIGGFPWNDQCKAEIEKCLGRQLFDSVPKAQPQPEVHKQPSHDCSIS